MSIEVPTAPAANPAHDRRAIQDYWNRESCGERYAVGTDREYYESHARRRYELEPWIRPFARFHEGSRRRVLEVGVGMGADYLEWLRSGAWGVGVDFTERAIGHTARRCRLDGHRPGLCLSDGERLPFKDGTFDIYYSWGVAHVSPNTAEVFAEAARVLRPGGIARFAIYHVRSWGGLAIWMRQALMKGRPFQSVRSVAARCLESPGTKLLSIKEARELCKPFRRIRQIRPQLGPADLLSMTPSEKYTDPISRLIWKLYPRWLIRRLGHRWGSYILIECEK